MIVDTIELFRPLSRHQKVRHGEGSCEICPVLPEYYSVRKSVAENILRTCGKE